MTLNYTPYDVTVDDQRFLLLRAAGGMAGGAGRLVIIENWFEELRGLVK